MCRFRFLENSHLFRWRVRRRNGNARDTVAVDVAKAFCRSLEESLCSVGRLLSIELKSLLTEIRFEKQNRIFFSDLQSINLNLQFVSVSFSFCNLFSASSKRHREIFELWQSIFHRQHRLLIVHMQTWCVLECRNRCGVHVRQSQRRMIAHHVSATRCAPFALRHGRLGKCTDMLGAFHNLDRRRLPQSERVDWRRAPRATRGAMAKALAFRSTCRFDFHFATEARSFVHNRNSCIRGAHRCFLSESSGWEGKRQRCCLENLIIRLCDF